MTTPTQAPKSRWKAFGPGLLFAGAAVGVSHIVQSTRGGATFGTAAVLIVVASCLVKWPAFRFGPLYSAATGSSLLAGYRRQGKWVLALFGLLTVSILFTTLAAVTVVTAGLLINLLSLQEVFGNWGLDGRHSAALVSLGLLTGTAILLALGGYRWLDLVMKVAMPILVVATLIATIIALTRMSAGNINFLPPIDTSGEIGLTAAIVGWMPAPLDIAVWSSLWALARARTSGTRLDSRGVLQDFDAGYILTLGLAVCFVLMGAAMMYNTGNTFSNSAAAFAGEVVNLYTEQLGNWSWPVIAIAAFLAMLSTTVTVADGFPRAVAALVSEAWPERNQGPEGAKSTYWVVFALGAVGAMLILVFMLGREGVNFTHLVDFVTITSFIAAPILAYLNHRVVHSDEVPAEFQPSPLLRTWSWFGIVVMGSFALAYVVFRIWGLQSTG
ncbi:MAG: hypothetical protein MK085_04765 [Phycisphaerales bacterium]|nr:hypothetical protein [Phycisphaerales bacterium]